MGQNIYGGRITGTMSTGAPITATKFYGDGSSLTGVATSGNFLQAPVFGQNAISGGYWGKTTHDLFGYGVGALSMVSNKIFLVPFQEQQGYTINTLGLCVSTLVSGGTCSFAIYNAVTASVTYNSLTQTTTVPGTFSSIGSISTTTTGQKIITGINYVLPTTLNNTYFLAMQTSTGTGAVQSWSSPVFSRWQTGTNISATFYRSYLYEYTAPSFAFVNNINTASYSLNTGADLPAILYTTK